MQQFNYGHIEGTLAANPSVIAGRRGARFIRFAITTPEASGAKRNRAANQTIDVTLFCKKGDDISPCLQMNEGDTVTCTYWIEARKGRTQNFMVLCASEVKKVEPAPAFEPEPDVSYEADYYGYSRDSWYDAVEMSYEFTPDDELFENARYDAEAREELARRGVW